MTDRLKYTLIGIIIVWIATIVWLISLEEPFINKFGQIL